MDMGFGLGYGMDALGYYALPSYEPPPPTKVRTHGEIDRATRDTFQKSSSTWRELEYRKALETYPAREPLGELMPASARAGLLGVLQRLNDAGVRLGVPRHSFSPVRLFSAHKAVAPEVALSAIESQHGKFAEGAIAVRGLDGGWRTVKHLNDVRAMELVHCFMPPQIVAALRSLNDAGVEVRLNVQDGSQHTRTFDALGPYQNEGNGQAGLLCFDKQDVIAGDRVLAYDFIRGSGQDHGLLQPDLAAAAKALDPKKYGSATRGAINSLSRERIYCNVSQGKAASISEWDSKKRGDIPLDADVLRTEGALDARAREVQALHAQYESQLGSSHDPEFFRTIYYGLKPMAPADAARRLVTLMKGLPPKAFGDNILKRAHVCLVELDSQAENTGRDLDRTIEDFLALSSQIEHDGHAHAIFPYVDTELRKNTKAEAYPEWLKVAADLANHSVNAFEAEDALVLAQPGVAPDALDRAHLIALIKHDRWTRPHPNGTALKPSLHDEFAAVMASVRPGQTVADACRVYAEIQAAEKQRDKGAVTSDAFIARQSAAVETPQH